MSRTRIAFLAALLAMPLSAPALAADAVTMGPPEPPAVDLATSPAYLWSGAYAGVFGSYGRGEFSALPGARARGFSGGAYGGYNWQIDQFVVGGEADLGLSGLDTASAGISAEQGAFGSLRARLGYDVNPFLLYATGGLAASKFTLASAAGSDSNVHLGWTAGAGAEAFITENITARLEYRYSDYQTENYNLGGVNVSSGFDDHSVRMGIGVKF